MKRTFDAYEAWLGLPSEEAPFHWYQILGLELFEADPAEILESFRLQRRKVLPHLKGEHGDRARKMLLRLNEARDCLTNASTKRKYDRALARKLEGSGNVLAEARPAPARPARTAGQSHVGAGRSQIGMAGRSQIGMAGRSQVGLAQAPQETLLVVNPGPSQRVANHYRRRVKGETALTLLVVGMVACLFVACVALLLVGNTQISSTSVASARPAGTTRPVGTPVAAPVSTRIVPAPHRLEPPVERVARVSQPRSSSKTTIPAWRPAEPTSKSTPVEATNPNASNAYAPTTVATPVQPVVAVDSVAAAVVQPVMPPEVAGSTGAVNEAIGNMPSSPMPSRGVPAAAGTPAVATTTAAKPAEPVASAESALDLAVSAPSPALVIKSDLDGVECVRISPDGRSVITGGTDRILRLISIDTGEEIRRFHGHSDAVHAVRFSDRGDAILSASSDGTVRIWETATGKLKQVLRGHDGPVSDIAVSRDGLRAVSTGLDRTIRVWNLLTNEPQRTINSPHLWTRVTFADDNRKVVAGAFDGTVQMFDGETGSELRKFEGLTGPIHQIEVCLSDTRVVATDLDGQTVIWNLADAKEVTRWGQPGDPQLTFDFARDTLRAVSSGEHGELLLYGLDSMNVVNRWQGPAVQIGSLAISKDGRRAVSWSWDRTLRSWELGAPQGTGLR